MISKAKIFQSSIPEDKNSFSTQVYGLKSKLGKLQLTPETYEKVALNIFYFICLTIL